MDQNRRFRDGIQTADARADHHTRAQFVVFILGRPTCVLNRLLSRCNTIKNEIIHFAPFFRQHPVVGIKCAVRAITKRHFAGIFRGHT